MDSFDIKPDDKFFSRLVSKESSGSNPSFRVYYGDVCGAVPFTWESRPGTPKFTLFTHSQLPPLTPPPSYYFHTTPKSTHNITPNHKPRSNLLRCVFTRSRSDKAPVLLTVSNSSSSSSSSLSRSPNSYSSFSRSSINGRRRRFSSWGSSFDDGGGDEHQPHPVRDGSNKSLIKLSRLIRFPLGRKVDRSSVVGLKYWATR